VGIWSLSADELLHVWLLCGLVTTLGGIWAIAAPKVPRDRPLGFLAIALIASQFLIILGG
jgi:hypothetical protein